MAVAQMGAHLYVIMGATGDLKVGRSKNPKKRMRSMQTSHSAALRLIGVLRDAGCREKEVHATLARYRVTGEWFRDCDAVRDALNAVFEKELPFLGSRESVRRLRQEREVEEAMAKALGALRARPRSRPKHGSSGGSFAAYKARSDARQAARMAKKPPPLFSKFVASPPSRG
ncbi:MAG TPA: GIY-YIG nuclease family protein [Acetobacteraceae bacterium]|nr:GIY-YIG nuclease family protein [Acetobacteraceae bacterium]